jgi:putative transposase
VGAVGRRWRMTAGLRRLYGTGDLHFVTFSCYQRMASLDSCGARDLFVSELARGRGEYGFGLVGYVVMPNHVHMLIGEPCKGTVSTVLQMLKQRTSRKLRKLETASMARRLEPLWQSRFYDFNVYSRSKVEEKLRYMHANPVTRGLVGNPKDWIWSSWSFYEKGEIGLVEIDCWS